MAIEQEVTVEELDSRFKLLNQRREVVQQNKIKIEAELNSRKRELKSLMKQAEDAGYDPANLKDEIKRMKQVLVVKLDAFQADLEAAEKMIQPMIKEIS
jgi:chromosome segregation ATPase